MYLHTYGKKGSRDSTAEVNWVVELELLFRERLCAWPMYAYGKRCE